jgi:NADP-dependent 3-hydroxy acid dehydrogenase YdfG
MEQLDGRVAVITGASSGIGMATARALAAEGAHVVLAARRQERLESVQRSIYEARGTAMAVIADVTRRDNLRAVVERAENEYGPVDILVNNAGIMLLSQMRKLREEEWERMIDVNLKGVLNGIAAVLDGMLARGRGDIITISSDAGRKVFPGSAIYSATKWGVEAIVQGLRLETAGTGLRVTSIQPGAVATELASHITDEDAIEGGKFFASMRTLDPEDVARAVLFVATQPAHVSINEILLRPSEQGS